MKKLKILFILLLTAAIVSGCNVSIRPIRVYHPHHHYPHHHHHWHWSP
jgi:PBP1b-binding outer membrane lipoprotein LpoB